jgi:NADPH-dependent 2,4-dienoyl-CoA reductase/sulfur reductase-like enzyme
VRAERLLILGNGGAAVSAARSARDSGHPGEIHLVSDVDGPAFNPMLSPYFLKGSIPWGSCFPFGLEWYSAYDVTCHFGSAVEFLDVLNRRAILEGGERLPYDKCLVATGAAPVVPPVPGLRGSSRVHVMRTAASVRRLDKAIASARRVLVLGASFVGLKAAEILARRGIGVTLLDVADRVLPLGAHPDCAAHIRSLFEGHGVKVHLGCSMDGMESSPQGAVCHFEDDVVREADLVVVCTGVRANVDFVDPTLVRMDKGILVDELMETNVPGLYAAGDASQGANLLNGEKEWLGTWENARLQGRTAGKNLAGQEARYHGSIPHNIGPFFDWTYAQIGDTLSGDLIHHAFGDPERGAHAVLAFREDLLVGANLINCTHLAGRLRRMILGKEQGSSFLNKATSVRDIESVLDVPMDGRVSALRPSFYRGGR